jgi:signal transduction histidine kinase
VALHELVEDVINIEAPQAALRGITIRNNLPTQIPPLTGDADRLKQVLLNLTSNAVKYNREGGDVIISANVAQDGVCLSVADTGPGIAPENLEHLFKRFYRVPTDEYSAGGSGLGLTIARRIVQEHGGRLTVESEVGEGTTFYCWLPFSSVSEVVVAGP